MNQIQNIVLNMSITNTKQSLMTLDNIKVRALQMAEIKEGDSNIMNQLMHQFKIKIKIRNMEVVTI